MSPPRRGSPKKPKAEGSAKAVAPEATKKPKPEVAAESASKAPTKPAAEGAAVPKSTTRARRGRPSASGVARRLRARGGDGGEPRDGSREAIRRGVVNEGAFFSPYYLFDLMARAHATDLDFDGRERERRMLPRVYRRALARLDSTSTLAALWREWYSELFRALGHEPQNLAADIPTAHHGRVPVSHAVLGASGSPLVLVDLHTLGVDLDRDPYPRETASPEDLTREPIARAFELALDAQDARWGLLSNGTELRLYRRGSTVSRQFLAVKFSALFDSDRDDELTAFWGLFRRHAFVPGDSGKCLLDQVLEESHRHASRIAEDLRENAVDALEALVQGVLDEPENREIWGGGSPKAPALAKLFEESLYYLFRLLFILYAESRDILPVGESSTYRDTYSVEHLRGRAEREAHAGEQTKTYYAETLRTLFRMLRQGFRCADFSIPALGGRGPEDPDWARIQNEGDLHLTSLFDGRRTAWLDRCRISDRALRKVIRELSLSRPKRRLDRRERYSYADLGVDQLGSVYEGLLVYEPTIVTEPMVLASIKGEQRLVTKAQATAAELSILDDSEKRPGEFVLRLWGGRRKGSGSYYTPHEITAFLVKEALDPVVAGVLAKCAASRPKSLTDILDANEAPLFHPDTRHAEEILDIKVCDPAMGSGAFLIAACRYLAEAYGRALVAEGRDPSGRVGQEDLARHKRTVAERCLYGVDLNPLAVELAKVSLWLETLAHGRPLSFLDAHLRCGNSLVGAPLRDANGRFTAEHVGTIPSRALELVLVLKESPPERRARAKELIAANEEFLTHLAEGGAAGYMPLFDLDERQLEKTLQDYVRSRAALDESDENRSAHDALLLREEKERQFREVYLAPNAPVHRLKDICDFWCATWFWPEEEDEPQFESDSYRRAVSRVLRGEAPKEPWLATARRVAEQQRFFHWELEFPEVFLRENEGFDAMLGNPPWELLAGDIGEFVGEHDPLFKTLRGRARDERVKEALGDRLIGPSIVARTRSRSQYARFAQRSPRFEGLVAGKINTFAPFAVLCWQLHRKHGASALVLKDAFHLGENLGKIRAEILKNGTVRVLATSDNERKVFDAMNRVRFDLVVATRGPAAESVPISVHRFRTAREIVDHAHRTVVIPLDLLKKSGIPTEPIPEIMDPLWSTLIERSRRAAGRWRQVKWSVELNSSSDKALWSREERPSESPGPVLAMVAAYDAFEYDALAWLQPDAPGQPAFTGVRWEQWRVGVRKRTNEERVLIGGIIPPKHATCDFLLTTEEPSDPKSVLMCAALANSLVLDFLIRPFVGSNMQKGILGRMPWALPQESSIPVALLRDVLSLVGTRAQYRGLHVAAGGGDVELAEGSRERCVRRASVDAQVAQLYELSAHEFARILTSFRVLDSEQPALPGEPKSFITRDLALLEYLHLRGEEPPKDVVAFFKEAGSDISIVTGATRNLEERVRDATAAGAVAYVPRRKRARGGVDDEEQQDTSEEEAEAAD